MTSAQVWLFDAHHLYQRTALTLLVLVQMTERVRKHVIELVLSTDMKQVRDGLRAKGIHERTTWL